MRKFIVIQDIRSCKCYASINARLVYLHIACQVDIKTYTCAKSLRQLSRELGMTLGEVRHALHMLVDEGLIATHTATHTAAHNATHLTTQLTTHLTILRTNENGAPNGAPNDTPNNTPNDTPNNTPNNTQNKEYNNTISEKLSHTRARECVTELEEVLEKELGIGFAEAREMVEAFLRRQDLKRKEWNDQGDLLAHCVSWAEKHMRTKRTAKRTDTQARQEEYQRAAEEVANKSDEDKDREELRTILAWIHDGEAKMAKAKTDKDKEKWAAYVTIQRTAYQEKLSTIKQ